MSALLIGIDRYDSNVVPDLSGCLRDVALMETYLRESAGISNINKLTSPANKGVKVPAPDSLPTASNVIAALKKLAHEAQRNDFVYIHFSGHGSRCPTKFQDLNRNPQDECLVLVRDFSSVKSRKVDYLCDVELAYLLKNITDKGAIVTIVLDCCHSGGATRDCPSESSVPPGESYEYSVTRGVDSLPEYALVAREPVRRLSVLEQFRADQATNAVRSASFIEHWMTSSQGVEFLAACDSNQTAQEIQHEGIRRGLLTECLLRVLQDHHSYHKPLTCGMIYNLVSSKVATHPKRTQPQTVVFGGKRCRFFFGTGRSEPNETIANSSTRLSNDELQIELSAGKAHGVVEGDIYALYPPDRTLASLMAYNSPSAVCRVSQVDNFSSTAIFKGALTGVSANYKAVRQSEILEKNVFAQRSAKLLPLGNATTEAHQSTNTLDKLDYERSLVSFPDTELPFFHIYSDGASRFNIAFNHNPEPTVHVQSEAALLSHLLHMSIFYNLLDLTTPSGYNGDLSVQKIGYFPTGKNPPDPRPYTPNGGPQAPPGLESFKKTEPQEIYENESIGLQVCNNSHKKVFIEILDLEPSWQATKVYPVGDNAPTLLLPGEAADFFFKMAMPGSVTHPQPSDFDTIIVLGTMNEHGNFPKGILPLFSETLEWQGSSLKRAETTRGATGFDSEQWYAQRVDVRVLKSGPK
ncbi:hypothetical protein NUW58_g8294 [Xylaria curta]|uniref:Uncharacterized protein n=1 Tax=Xylaria curta TaxID=42375 RepID=A0ACC1N9U9_9PEZI|nr:hypothetical protein NUW58_g8294 [Xylaria curta]